MRIFRTMQTSQVFTQQVTYFDFHAAYCIVTGTEDCAGRMLLVVIQLIIGNSVKSEISKNSWQLNG